MAEVELRRAGVEDAVGLTHLHLDCWDDAYTGLVPQEILDARRVDLPAQIETRRRWLATGPGTLLAEIDGRLIGFANAGPPRDEAVAVELGVDVELRALYVRAAHWGEGVGHRLLEASVGEADCYLWVLEGNHRAIGFYRSHGFVPDGEATEEPEGRHLRMVRRSGDR